jgi:hypothetical protein
MPSAISRFGGRIIEPGRGLRVIVAAMIAFFDRAFGGDRPSLEPVRAKFPELVIERGR